MWGSKGIMPLAVVGGRQSLPKCNVLLFVFFAELQMQFAELAGAYG